MSRVWTLLGLVLATPALAQDDAPLSAIDWLSQSVEAPVLPGIPDAIDNSVTNSASVPEVITTPLDRPTPDTVGLLSPSTTGLPRTLWSASSEEVLITLIRAENMPMIPSIRDFLIVLLLAEADAPLGAGPDGALFLARVDKLLDMGALAQAQALLEEAQPDTPALFRRWFDVALLTGTEDDACRVMQDRPGIAPTSPARIFCLAREGDWSTAALTLNTRRVLGDITEEEEAILSRFLDPDLFEDEADLPPPERISPLVFRMREAIGQGLNTSRLPLAFSFADLRDTSGWKTQLDAAERLARHGALPANTLQDLFGHRTPSASGGVWDRVEAFQRFDTAFTARDPGAVSRRLPAAWDAMTQIRGEVPFAALYATGLNALPLSGSARQLSEKIGLLSSGYELAARDAQRTDPFLVALAQGQPGTVDARGTMQKAVQDAFLDGAPTGRLSDIAGGGKLGEALLRAIANFNAGVDGDPAAITQSLAFFRSVGLEDLARRTALQLLILDRRS